MKNFLIASTLCAAMLLPLIPVHAHAAEPPDPAGQTIAELTLAPRGTKGIVSMTFDDGNQATATWLNEKFKQYDLYGSTMMITANNFATADQIAFWRDIFDDGRLAPESHSKTHMVLPSESWASKNDPDTLNNNTDENFHSEIYESGLAIRNLFGSFPLCFAPSNNTMSDEGMHIVKNYYYAMRQGTRFGADIQSLDPVPDSSEPGGWYNLYMTGTKNAEEKILNGLNAAATRGGWLVIMCHGIGESSGDSTYAKFEPILQEMAKAQQKGDVWVTTFGEATKYIRQRQNTTVNVQQNSAGTYTLSLTMAQRTADRLALPTDVFNLPLTVRINLPEGATHLAYDTGEGEELVEGMVDERGRYMLLDMRAGVDRAKLRFTNENGESILSSDILTMKHSAAYSDAFTYTLYVREDQKILRAKIADGEWIEKAQLKTKSIDGESYVALPYTPPLHQAPKTFCVTLMLEENGTNGICTVSCSLTRYFNALLASAAEGDASTEMLALNAMILLRDIANAQSITFEDYQCVQDAIMKYHYRPKAPEEFALTTQDTATIHATLHYDLPSRPAIVVTPDSPNAISEYTFSDAQGNPIEAIEQDGKLVILLSGTYALREITVHYGTDASLTYSLGQDYARVKNEYEISSLYISFYQTLTGARQYLGAHSQ